MFIELFDTMKDNMGLGKQPVKKVEPKKEEVKP